MGGTSGTSPTGTGQRVLKGPQWSGGLGRIGRCGVRRLGQRCLAQWALPGSSPGRILLVSCGGGPRVIILPRGSVTQRDRSLSRAGECAAAQAAVSPGTAQAAPKFRRSERKGPPARFGQPHRSPRGAVARGLCPVASPLTPLLRSLRCGPRVSWALRGCPARASSSHTRLHRRLVGGRLQRPPRSEGDRWLRALHTRSSVSPSLSVVMAPQRLRRSCSVVRKVAEGPGGQPCLPSVLEPLGYRGSQAPGLHLLLPPGPSAKRKH